MNIGVVVGRFQVPELTTAHQELLHRVASKSDVLCVVLGTTENLGSRRNPLDFTARQMMIQNWAHYVDLSIPLIILGIPDHASDEIWSQNLEKMLRATFPAHRLQLYGGRDCFIQSYRGSLPTYDVCADIGVNLQISGTDIRASVANQAMDTPAFRAGVIYGAYNRWPIPYMCVDAALIGDNNTVYLGRKSGETQYRFFGGFLDAVDQSLEAAIRREVLEETGVELLKGSESVVYLDSVKVKDYRYRGNDDGSLMTAFFACRFSTLQGRPQAADDIDEIQGFDLKTVALTEFRSKVVDYHQELLSIFRQKIC